MNSATINWFCCVVTSEEDFHALGDNYLTDHLSTISLEKLKRATAADPLFKAVTARPEEFRGKFKIIDLMVSSSPHQCLLSGGLFF